MLGKSLEILVWMGVTLNILSMWLKIELYLKLMLPLNMCLAFPMKPYAFERKDISLKGAPAPSLQSSGSFIQRVP